MDVERRKLEMQLTFYRGGRELLKITNRLELLRVCNGGALYNLQVYLGNTQLGRLDIRLRNSAIAADTCMLSRSGLSNLVLLEFELDKFISFLERDDISLEEFVNASLWIKNACLIYSDCKERDEEEIERLRQRVSKERKNYEYLIHFYNRQEHFGKFCQMPIFLLYNRKRR